MEQIKLIKKQLVLDLDVNGAPTNWMWKVDRVIRFDEGDERVVADTIKATPEEVQEHVGVAVTKQAADIARDSAERDELRRKLNDAVFALRAVAAADASWDLETRGAVASALEANK